SPRSLLALRLPLAAEQHRGAVAAGLASLAGGAVAAEPLAQAEAPQVDDDVEVGGVGQRGDGVDGAGAVLPGHALHPVHEGECLRVDAHRTASRARGAPSPTQEDHTLVARPPGPSTAPPRP